MKNLCYRKWRIGFCVVMVGALTLWLMVYPHRSKEPSYQGRTLTEWLSDCSVYPPPVLGESPRVFNSHFPATEHAVKEIGTNAIPTLLEMLQAGDSTTDLKAKLNVLLNRQSIIHFRFRSGSDYRRLAVFGFEILNKDAAPAVPALIGLLNNQHTIARYHVIQALENIGPAAKGAVPALLLRVNDEEVSTRYAVRYALTKIDPEAAAKAGVK
ncbi:MAG TPA: hypothetical protein VN887_12165 [Candidatus Angelobacter sp.]|nr:hypothetical protein [Candidatus Angelobacter sp.]